MPNLKIAFAVALIALCLASCQEPSAPPTIAGTPLPAQATIPSAAVLRQLYADKTWFWADGGGYFDPTGGFHAATGTGDKTNYATGFWWTTDQGALCFDATWHAKKTAAGSAITCFDHRRDGNVWYQRKEPGSWYVFKSDPVKPEDEFEKLKPGNQIEALLQKARTTLGMPSS